VTLVLENEPPAVRARINPPRLTRVFHNFINNATDAMPKGGPIRIRFQLTDKELITEVQDCGKGIAPEIAGRLFQAFATYGKANGTGLGLSICRKIIQDHQGRIYAQNAPDGGAVFGFALPYEAAEPA
jgi:signal transduction histidine kinase